MSSYPENFFRFARLFASWAVIAPGIAWGAVECVQCRQLGYTATLNPLGANDASRLPLDVADILLESVRVGDVAWTQRVVNAGLPARLTPSAYGRYDVAGVLRQNGALGVRRPGASGWTGSSGSPLAFSAVTGAGGDPNARFKVNWTGGEVPGFTAPWIQATSQFDPTFRVTSEQLQRLPGLAASPGMVAVSDQPGSDPLRWYSGRSPDTGEAQYDLRPAGGVRYGQPLSTTVVPTPAAGVSQSLPSR